MNRHLVEGQILLAISNISTTHHKQNYNQRRCDQPFQFPHYKACKHHLISNLESPLFLLDCPKWVIFFSTLSTLKPKPLKEHKHSKSLRTFPSFDIPPNLIEPCKPL